MGVSKKLLVPSVIDAVVQKVNEKRITNSKDLRKLRAILPDPVARAHFLSDSGDLESAQIRVRQAEKRSNEGLFTDLEAAVQTMKNVPWTALQELKGDVNVLKKLDDAEKLLQSLRKALTSI
jgi:ParB family chromosome partitioning protein